MPFSLEDRVGPEHGMLIVIDMQNDFCYRDGAACKRGRDMAFVQDMIPRLVNLVNQARAHNFPICFVKTSGNQWTNSPVWTEFKNPELLACAEGTWGAEFHAGLEPRDGDMIVTKHRYSAFIGTDLDMLLRARGVKSLLVTGVGTGMCVFHTLTVGFSSKIAAPRLTDRKRITKRWRWSKNTTVALPYRKRSAIFGRAKFVRPASKKPRAVAL